MNKQAIALQQAIVEKEKQSLALLEELRRSLAIQRLIPTAFDHGSVSTRWTGHPNLRNGERGPLKKCTITLGNGEQITFKPEQVPQELHPL